MAKVYGYSDDIVCIEHLEGGCTEIDCFDKEVVITFEDGTEILVGYGKLDKAIWWIRIARGGSAFCDLIPCDDEDAEIYSDILEIDSEVFCWNLVEAD